MKVAIDINEEQSARLNAEAAKLGVSPEALAKAAVIDVLERKEKLANAVNYVLGKNAEAVLMAVLVVLGLSVGEIPAAGSDPSILPTVEMGPAIEPGG